MFDVASFSLFIVDHFHPCFERGRNDSSMSVMMRRSEQRAQDSERLTSPYVASVGDNCHLQELRLFASTTKLLPSIGISASILLYVSLARFCGNSFTFQRKWVPVNSSDRREVASKILHLLDSGQGRPG
jgi:hypothetical protein